MAQNQKNRTVRFGSGILVGMNISVNASFYMIGSIEDIKINRTD